MMKQKYYVVWDKDNYELFGRKIYSNYEEVIDLLFADYKETLPDEEITKEMLRNDFTIWDGGENENFIVSVAEVE